MATNLDDYPRASFNGILEALRVAAAGVCAAEEKHGEGSAEALAAEADLKKVCGWAYAFQYPHQKDEQGNLEAREPPEDPLRQIELMRSQLKLSEW